MHDKSLRGSVRVRAFAKINLALRVLALRADGFHELRTTFQTLALHDTLTFSAASGPFAIDCDDEACPRDRTNLVWRAADEMWRLAGRRGAIRGVRVGIRKRIPLRSGLGGGSSDAAAALRALALLWRVKVHDHRLQLAAAALGADVPFFLHGGAALGVGRGDVLFPLVDPPPTPVVVVVPEFGVSTRDAYSWFDRTTAGSSRTRGRPSSFARAPVPRSGSSTLLVPRSELVNDLQAPVVEQHPEIGRLVAALRRVGASYAAMSGSGAAVFGLFDAQRTAEGAARRLAAPFRRVIVTRTLSRSRYQVAADPRLAARRT